MDQPPTKQFYSWDEYFSLLEELKSNINFEPDVVVSIGKGGSIPGVVLAEHYDTINLNFGVKSYTKHTQSCIEEYQTIDDKNISKKNVLLVDDLTDSGSTLTYVTKKLKRAGCGVLKTACLFLKDKSSYKPDYYVETIPSKTWIVQPWEKE